MQLTKDEIDALAKKARDHQSFAALIIAALQRKALEDVEPVPGAVAYGEVVYSAHTVAALKSRADALAARVAELEKDARRLDAVERNRFELTPLEGGGWDVSQYHSETCDSQLFAVGELTARAAIDSAALAAKGQA